MTNKKLLQDIGKEVREIKKLNYRLYHLQSLMFQAALLGEEYVQVRFLFSESELVQIEAQGFEVLCDDTMTTVKWEKE